MHMLSKTNKQKPNSNLLKFKRTVISRPRFSTLFHLHQIHHYYSLASDFKLLRHQSLFCSRRKLKLLCQSTIKIKFQWKYCSLMLQFYGTFVQYQCSAHHCLTYPQMDQLSHPTCLTHLCQGHIHQNLEVLQGKNHHLWYFLYPYVTFPLKNRPER